MPSRRRLLRLGAAGSAAALAGCFSLESEPEPVRLVLLEALNYHAEPHEIHVRITGPDDGEVRYEGAVSVPSGEPQPAVAEFDGSPETVTDGVLTAWRDDQSPEDHPSTDLSKYAGTECLGYQVNVGSFRGDPDDARVALYSTTNCNAGD